MVYLGSLRVRLLRNARDDVRVTSSRAFPRIQRDAKRSTAHVHAKVVNEYSSNLVFGALRDFAPLR